MVTRSSTPASRNTAVDRATVAGRSTSVPPTPGCARSTSASSDPVPPPTSTTVRTESQSPDGRTFGSGAPWPGPISASKLSAIRGMSRRSSQNGWPKIAGYAGRSRADTSEQAVPRIRHAAADRVEVHAVLGGRLEQPSRRVVEREAAGRRLDEHALADEMPQDALQGLAVRSRRGGERVDIGGAGRQVIGDAQRDGDVQAPRRGEIRQHPQPAGVRQADSP